MQGFRFQNLVIQDKIHNRLNKSTTYTGHNHYLKVINTF